MMCALRFRILSQCRSAFTNFGLSAPFLSALEEAKLVNPTPVQKLVIPKILRGTGKTLAYLLPLMQRLKNEETENIERRPLRPRAVVLVPTRELAYQVLSVAKQISHHVKLRTTAVSGGTKSGPQRIALEEPVDLLVATPGRFLQHREKGHIFFTDVRYIVLDEADTLVGADFASAVDKIVKPIQENPRQRVQSVCVSATLPGDKIRIMNKLFPKSHVLLTADAHHNPSNVEQVFVRVPGKDKFGELEKVLKANSRLRTLVFCNTIASCRATEHFLREHGFSTVCFHGGIRPLTREANWNEFLKTPHAVVVCTDAAARGLDTTMIQHVVQLDFPRQTIDYLHRVGRTGRMGKPGKVTSLIGKYDVKLAVEIQKSAKKALSLEDTKRARPVAQTPPA